MRRIMVIQRWCGPPTVPGMQVNAEIHLGTRSVLEYLLSPVQKVAHEAGGAGNVRTAVFQVMKLIPTPFLCTCRPR